MGGFKAALVCPVWVVIEQRDQASTVYDADAREPVKQVRRNTSIRLKAQISYSRTAGTSFFQGGQGGPSTDAAGHLVFLTKTLTANSYAFARGDRIITIGGQTVEHYLDEKERAGHNDGTPGLEVWEFQDYDPRKK